MPGGALAGFMFVPITLLAALCFTESKPWRLAFTVALVLWLGFAIVWPALHRDWARLIFPALIIVFWIFMSEVKQIGRAHV